MIFSEVSKRMNKEFAKSAVPGFSTPNIKNKDVPFSIMDLMMKP